MKQRPFYTLDNRLFDIINDDNAADIWHSPLGIYTLENNIDRIKISWNSLSANPYAIHLLEANRKKINMFYLSKNPKGVHLIKELSTFLNWNWLSANPGAIELLKKYPRKISWWYISENPNAIELLREQIKQIKYLKKNINDKILLDTYKQIKINSSVDNSTFFNLNDELKEYLSKNNVDWYRLSANPNAIKILEENYKNICWEYLSSNPNAIHILEKNLHKICWKKLSENPCAINILKKNLDKICWNSLAKNPKAIHLLEKNIELVNLRYLISNQGATHLIKEKLKDILSNKNNYYEDDADDEDDEDDEDYEDENNENIIKNSGNPNIICLLYNFHYENIKHHFYSTYGKELIEWIYNPKNMHKWGKIYWDFDVLS